jgi:hypothetical protein
MSELVRQARRAGFSVEKHNSGHLHFTAPTGATVVTASTPGSYGSVMKAERQLRQAGLPAKGVKPERHRRPSNVEYRLLEQLQSARAPLGAEELSSATGLDLHVVESAMTSVRRHPEVEELGGRAWKFKAPEVKPALAPAPVRRRREVDSTPRIVPKKARPIGVLDAPVHSIEKVGPDTYSYKGLIVGESLGKWWVVEWAQSFPTRSAALCAIDKRVRH